MRRFILAAIPIVLAPAAARAQPDDPPPLPPGEPGGQPGAGADAGGATKPPAPPPGDDESPPPQPEKLADPYAGFAPPLPPKPPIEVQMPVLFSASTGYLPPAGVIIGGAGVDTGGGVGADLRVGLGDVAEFGVGTTDLIRTRICDPVCTTSAVQPYPLALFKMGLAEDRLFRNQPALALGFRKSFERDHDDRSSRVAELYLVASKRVGRLTRLHAGATVWDAAIRREDGGVASEFQLHSRGLRHMLRAYGGVDIEALPRSHLIMELMWAPELQLGQTADNISLTPMFAWGVRYQLADWMLFESGVRIPNIRDVNLLDAQIFGQVRLISRRFARFLATDR
jgi:hypothetical protein